MKKTYAMQKLLEHGPLTLAEAREITLWGGKTTAHVLEYLKKKGVLVCKHYQQERKHRYSLA